VLFGRSPSNSRYWRVRDKFLAFIFLKVRIQAIVHRSIVVLIYPLVFSTARRKLYRYGSCSRKISIFCRWLHCQMIAGIQPFIRPFLSRNVILLCLSSPQIVEQIRCLSCLRTVRSHAIRLGFLHRSIQLHLGICATSKNQPIRYLKCSDLGGGYSAPYFTTQKLLISQLIHHLQRPIVSLLIDSPAYIQCFQIHDILLHLPILYTK